MVGSALWVVGLSVQMFVVVSVDDSITGTAVCCVIVDDSIIGAVVCCCQPY